MRNSAGIQLTPSSRKKEGSPRTLSWLRARPFLLWTHSQESPLLAHEATSL
ncbi:rCG33666 [Rattus norvegicus]|uniref:RCG33666 n=1 Tax=Rattus norvegicus TaxID=10116 RepID=A6HFB6_RAT|nr:rCG33666 [Rattus norvegicus]